jgi:hypothetical protein
MANFEYSEYKTIIDKIAYEIGVFLNSRRVSASTVKIEINREFKTYLNLEHEINTSRYTIVNRRAIRIFRIRKYLTHNSNEGRINLTQLQFKFVPERVSNIRKRIRLISIRSPIYLSIRMRKFLDPNMTNDSLDEHNDWEERRRRRIVQ